MPFTSLFGKREPEPETPQPETAQQSPNATAEKPRSFFDRMRQAVTRTRQSLSDQIASVVALTREIDETSLDELEFALLASDIGAPTANEIITRLRDRALRHGLANGAELKAALKDEIRRILDSVNTPVRHASHATRSHPPRRRQRHRQDHHLRQARRPLPPSAKGRSVLLCAADTFRAAAIEQLEVWAERSGVALIKTRQGGDPSAALFDAATAAKARSTDILLVDTAGRLHTKSDLMKELDKMRRTAERQVPGSPHQTLLVIDATTGQNGLQQARLFTEAAHVTGIVLTKLDGTAKGGIVVAIARELRLPVRYVGVGEKLEDILPFDSASFVDSLLD